MSSRAPLLVLSAPLLVLSALLLPPAAAGVVAAQEVPRDRGTLTGEVVDDESGDPIEGVHLLLPEVGASTVTNENGRFIFPSLPPGSVALRVERIGYAAVDGEVEIERGRTTETRIRLSTEAIPLDPIVVTAVRRRVELPGLEGFERRYHSGWGDFILAEDIRRRSPMKLTDMLWETGLDVSANGAHLTSRRGKCSPAVYLDGIRIAPRLQDRRGSSGGSGPYLWPDASTSPAAEAAAAVNMVNPHLLLAVEVYRSRLETPGAYADHYAKCGVILIWSRRGGSGR